LGRLADLDRRQLAHVGVVDGDGEVKRVADVDLLAGGADADGPWVRPQRPRIARLRYLLVVVIDDVVDVHVVGAGVDGVQLLAVGRDGGLPRVAHDVDAVVGVHADRRPPLRLLVGGHQVADRQVGEDGAVAVVDGYLAAYVRQVRLGALRVEDDVAG